MVKPDKISKVDVLKGHLTESKSVFITDYTGLNVAKLTILRKNLRENSVKYFVEKNTLLKIAAKETGYDGIVNYLQGQIAVAFAKDDPAIAAKILYNAFKENEKPVIRAFVLDKQTFPGTEIVRLAELPSREILLAQVIGAVESPLTAVIMSVDAVFQELVGTIDALAKSKSA